MLAKEEQAICFDASYSTAILTLIYQIRLTLS